MEEPTYDLIASPVSAFTTFGEAAPTPEATVEGMPAPPIDQVGPVFAQLEQLSSTLTNLFSEQQRKTGIMKEGQGEIAAANIDPQELEKLREENALSIAGLVDKGLLSAEENPWFYVGAKRALAKKNALAIQNGLAINLVADFNNNEGSLSTGPDVSVAIARYLADKTNPLGLDQDILDDYYYASEFESAFSRIRQNATSSLIEMRNEQAVRDQVEGIQADVVEALPGGLINTAAVRQAAVDLSNGKITQEDFERISATVLDGPESVAAVLADYGNRAMFGNKKSVEVVGMFLIELAKDGNENALDALKNTKLGSGQTILDNDAVKAAYALAEKTIDSTLQRAAVQRRDDERIARNREVENSVLDAIGSQLFNDPNTNPGDLPNLIDGLRRDPNTGEFQFAQLDRYGNISFTSVNIEQIRTEQLRKRFELRANSAFGGTREQRNQVLADAMIQGQREGYTHPEVAASVKKGMDLVFGGQTVTEGDLDGIQSTLSLYRLLKSSGDRATLNAYFQGDSAGHMYILDLLEKGSLGALGSVEDPGPFSSGNLQGSIALVQQMDVRSDAFKAELREFNTKFNSLVMGQGINPLILNQIRATGEVAIRLGRAVSPSDLVDNLVVTGKHFTFSPMYGVGISKESGEELFDELILFTRSRGELLREGTVARTIQDAAMKNSTGAFGSDEYFDWIDSVRFVHAPDASGGFVMYSGSMPFGADRFTLEQFRADQTYRLSVDPEKRVLRNMFTNEPIRTEYRDVGRVVSGTGTRDPSPALVDNVEGDPTMRIPPLIEGPQVVDGENK